MKHALLALALTGAALPGLAQEARVPDRGLGPAHRFKILYAGSPGGFREGAYVEFLRGWFDVVDAIDLRGLDAAAAAPYDVVLADWRSWYGNDGYPEEHESHDTRLPADFAKPVILIGAVGGELVPESKIGWL